MLVQGYRTLPNYVVEHDYVGDLASVTNNGSAIDKNDPSQYIRYVSRCNQSTSSFGSDAISWIYYCHPNSDKGSDPFGYIDEASRQKYGDFCYEYGTWQPINGTEDKSITGVRATGTTSNTTTTTTTMVGNIRDVKTEWSDKIVDAAKRTPYAGSGYCQAWVENVYRNAGLNPGDGCCCAGYASRTQVVSTDINSIAIGATVYSTGSGKGSYEYNEKYGGGIHTCHDGVTGESWGHVGIYIGNGYVMDNSSSQSTPRTIPLKDWIKTEGEQYRWLGWGWADPSLANGATIASTTSNYTGQLDKTQTGDGYNATYTSSAGITYREYKQDQGSYAGDKYWDSNIAGSGCGPASVAILASGIKANEADKYTPKETTQIVKDYCAKNNIKEESSNANMKMLMDSIGLSTEIIEGDISASEIQNQLRSGKVMMLLTEKAKGSIFPLGSGHFITAVDINDKGEIFILNPGSKKGVESGWYDADVVANGCTAIFPTYAGVGIASTTETTSSESAAPGYQAVVATYKEIDKSLDAAGPNLDGAAADFGISLDTEPSYTISTTTVNYEDLVQPYTLQFDLLWTLLVLGQSKEFVFELADLAYNSDLEVSIYDNLTTTTDIDNCTYTEVTDAKVYGYVSCNGYVERIDHTHLYENGDPLSTENGHINKTVITRTNTIQYALTKANTWIANYSIEYKYSKEDGTSQSGQKTVDDHIVNDFSEAGGSGHICSIINSAIANVLHSANGALNGNTTGGITAYTDTGTSNGGNSEGATIRFTKADVVRNISMQTRIQRVSMVDNTEDRVDTIKYNSIPETASSVIKDDEKTKPNFVTIFNSFKYRESRNSILSAIDWFFAIIEENERMANSKDIVKYLIYKATNRSYGVTELDNELFYPGKFNMVSGGKGVYTGPVTGNVAEVIARAKSCLGVTYVYGSQDPPNSIDCTGLVCYAYSGIVGRHGPSSYDMYRDWPRVNRSPQPGDVLVINGHAALIIENNQVIEANGTEVAINPYKSVQDFLNQGYAVVLPPQIPYVY